MNLLTDEEGAFVLARAGMLVEAVVRRKPVEDGEYTPEFSAQRGVFVTLTEVGEFRGCIGIPYPVMPLWEALEDAAVSVAVRDPRFSPVILAELPDIRIEVTILMPHEALICQPPELPEHVVVGRHGLIAKAGSRSGLLLPQVAPEYGWTPAEFLSQTCTIFLFEGQIFSEE